VIKLSVKPMRGFNPKAEIEMSALTLGRHARRSWREPHARTGSDAHAIAASEIIHRSPEAADCVNAKT
jgi:hypothetical protein